MEHQIRNLPDFVVDDRYPALGLGCAHGRDVVERFLKMGGMLERSNSVGAGLRAWATRYVE